FKGIEVEYEPKQNRAATLTELRLFVQAADKDGTPSLGTAAMIAFYWLVREEDIFGRMTWSDYRPTDHPNDVLAWHHKNRKTEKIAIRVFDVDGTDLWAEMVVRFGGMKRTGTLIVMRDAPDPRKKIHLPWTTGGRNPMRWVQAEVRRICRAAGLPDEITFTHTDGVHRLVAAPGHRRSRLPDLPDRDLPRQAPCRSA